MYKINDLDDIMGVVISEAPYIKILSKIKFDENNIPTALAIVDNVLCVVELKITELPKEDKI